MKVDVRPDDAAAGAVSTTPPWWHRAIVVLAVGTLVMGLVMRFWTRSDLWLDEALTVNIAKLPLRDIPGALRHDGAPPLYYALLHVWMRVFGDSDVAVRALSGVISVGTLPLMWLAARRAAGRGAEWVGVVLLASSPFAIRYATETRMYSLVVLLVLVGYLRLVKALGRPRPTAGDMVALAVISGLLLLTHYWSLYLIVALGAGLVYQLVSGPPERRDAFRRMLIGIAGGGVLFAPWLPAFAYQLKHTGTPWADPASFSAMVNAVSEFAGGKSSSGRALALVFFAMAGIGLFGAAIDEWRIELDLRTRRRGRGLAFAGAATLAIAISIGLVTGSAFAARYTAVVFPLFLLLVTLGTGALAGERVRAAVVAAAVVCGLITATQYVTTNRTQAGAVAHAIRAAVQPGDVVGYCPDQLGPATSRLLPAGIQQVTFPRATGPRFVDWVDYGDHNRAGNPDAFAKLLDERAGRHAVWMVWSFNYRTFGNSCERINAVLAALRPGGRELVKLDNDKFFEHADLIRYPER
ncbi:MAG: hypothetical protein JWO37_1418 [Acidimicrobiales bacterium]|jgi:mannosyltransferase|nr:hypothetical protein [Acidimicrobiales bacterium]